MAVAAKGGGPLALDPVGHFSACPPTPPCPPPNSRRLTSLLGSSNQVKKSDQDEFQRLYLAAHYLSMAAECRANGLKDLSAKQLTSALRCAAGCW